MVIAKTSKVHLCVVWAERKLLPKQPQGMLGPGLSSKEVVAGVGREHHRLREMVGPGRQRRRCWCWAWSDLGWAFVGVGPKSGPGGLSEGGP